LNKSPIREIVNLYPYITIILWKFGKILPGNIFQDHEPPVWDCKLSLEIVLQNTNIAKNIIF